MSTTTTVTETKKVKRRKGKPGMTKEQLRVYLKLRSRIYYSDPDRKKEQAEKMRLHRSKNKDRINARKRFKDRRRSLEKKLKNIWQMKGII